MMISRFYFLSQILLLVLFFFYPVESFSEDVSYPWKESQKIREEKGKEISFYVEGSFERGRKKRKDGDFRESFEEYVKIQKEIPFELIKTGPTRWETARIIAFREMKELLLEAEKRGESSRLLPNDEFFSKIFEKAQEDGILHSYEVAEFFPYLPTKKGVYWVEKMGDYYIERGDYLRAYTWLKAIETYSIGYNARIKKKLNLILSRLSFSDQTVGTEPPFTLVDGTIYRTVLERGEGLWENKLFFLEISYLEGRGEGRREIRQTVRNRIYDFDIGFLSKYSSLIFRDFDEIVILKQTGERAIFFFDLDGNLLRKEGLTNELISRYRLENYFRVFSGDDFVMIPRGIFLMGSPEGEEGRDSNETLHEVTITKDFYLQSTEVTQEQWWKVMGENPSYFKEERYCPKEYDKEVGICPNHPVEDVSWHDAQDFIKKINEQNDGYEYRLPTEAEWEYAARVSGVPEGERKKRLTPEGILDLRRSGFAKSIYGFGNSVNRLDYYAWYNKNSDNQTRSVKDSRIHPIGGLYGMHGNVWEWVLDWDAPYPTYAATDPAGPSSGSYRVYRGGSWSLNPRFLRSADRNSYSPDLRSSYLGFRALRTKKE